MAKYQIVMDVAGDVELNIAKELGLNYLPMDYEIDETLYTCNGDNSDIKSFYGFLREGKIAKTTQITPYIYEEYFSKYLEKGISVLYLCLSSGLSSTYSSALTASKTLNEKYDAKLVVVDTLGATCSTGFLVEKAYKNLANGMSIEDNATDISNYRKSLIMYAFLQDLNHLKRGGRISASTAVVGTLLNIKPLITILPNGTLKYYDRVKGERLAVKKLAQIFINEYSGNGVVYICDADNEVSAELMKEELLSYNPDLIIRRTKLSPIIGTHLGPGAVIIGFEQKQ